MDALFRASLRRTDPARLAALEAVNGSELAPGHVWLVFALGFAAARKHGRPGDAELAALAGIDALVALRQRRATVPAADRARRLGIRKRTFLAVRGDVSRVLRRLLAGTENTRR